ncbi:hypothetical protein [Ligilactobacillus salivarius]|uniref:hypothetical protein n=1 Tax=Ligilactobacillus salivarius TaxID=1624 RepID=UPI0024B8B57F|nr:hypothetical protein [Ligilactobacillus salivarius]
MKAEYSQVEKVLDVLNYWCARYKYDEGDLYLALTRTVSMPIVDAFKPFKRIEVDAYFVEKANIALAAYKMFDTEDRNYMAKVIPSLDKWTLRIMRSLRKGNKK